MRPERMRFQRRTSRRIGAPSPKAQPPGNAQANERRIRAESFQLEGLWRVAGGVCTVPPLLTEGERRRTSSSRAGSLRSQDRGAQDRKVRSVALDVSPQSGPEHTRMGSRTPLYDTHVAAGARMVDFGGWDMPVNYGSQIDEHHAVRRDAGMFDVSHMLIADIIGPRTREYLRYLLANDVIKLKEPGKALYSCMLNEAGGVVDDLIVYFVNENWFRVVVNAGTRDKDTAWLRRHAAGFGVDIRPRIDLAMIAIQGPNARA